MGLLLMQFRKQQLLQAQNNIQFQLNNLNEQLMDLQSIAGTLSNDNISINDLASMPASLFGFGINQLMMAHGNASQYANNVMQNMLNASIFTQFGDNAKKLLDSYSNVSAIELHKLDNISDEERREKKDYILLTRDNLELIKREIYQ